ncbi:transposable element Tcb1 transposase [Trichonephila clavipes]|nr:transposable element Tcb1 transposase [Trichonephila clavipes]
MQKGTTDRRGRSHPPQSTTSREDRQILCMELTDRSVTSRTVAHHIESVTHHSVSARTIRRRLQQSGLSARRPLLDLPLTQNHRRLHRQWCDERSMWVVEWNEVDFTDESRICLQHHDGRIRVRRHRQKRILNSCNMHRHTGPAPALDTVAVRVLNVVGLSNGTVGIFSADKYEAEKEVDLLESMRRIRRLQKFWTGLAEDFAFRHCKGGQKIFVMLGSVWVVVDRLDGLVA